MSRWRTFIQPCLHQGRGLVSYVSSRAILCRCLQSKAPVSRTNDAPSEIISATQFDTDSILHDHELSLLKPSERLAYEKRREFGLVVNEFKKREKYSKGHVELITVAVNRMEELKLEKDVLVYNKIISIFPKGRFAPRRMLDAIWPRSLPQLELSLEILTKMEENGVRPNQETYNLLNEIFGKMSLPVQKCIRIAYLFDKFEFADPYKCYYGDLPTDPVELSKFILNRITGAEGEITVHRDNDEVGDSYILSAHTEAQSVLLGAELGDALLHVEGPHRLWQHHLELSYYSLRLTGGQSMIKLLPEHLLENAQREGTILSVCMCGPGRQDTLEDWMEMMQSTYPNLKQARIVYDLKQPEPEGELKELKNARTKTELLEESLD